MKIIIALLGGGLIKDSVGKWHSPTFDEGIILYNAPGSRERVVAAYFLWKENPDSTVLVLGGKGQMKDIPDAPMLAEAISRELQELGVPKEKIIEERESGTTYDQLQALQKIVVKQNLEKIIIVSNRYHMPRIQAMIEYAPELKLLGQRAAEFMEAEDILLAHDFNEWQKEIEVAYASSEMHELTAREENGIQEIRRGTYKFQKG